MKRPLVVICICTRFDLRELLYYAHCFTPWLLKNCRDSEKQDVDGNGDEDAKRNLPSFLLPLVFPQAGAPFIGFQ